MIELMTGLTTELMAESNTAKTAISAISAISGGHNRIDN